MTTSFYYLQLDGLCSKTLKEKKKIIKLWEVWKFKSNKY